MILIKNVVVVHLPVKLRLILHGPEHGFVVLDLEIPNRKSVPVLLDFDDKQPLGEAWLRRSGDDVLADLMLKDGTQTSGLYPAIGFVTYDQGSGEIDRIGLSLTRNVDETIPPLD